MNATTTSKSALTKDLNIIIADDAHTTADRPAAKAATLIKFYNWLWANLNPTDASISVCSSAEILK